MAKKDKHVSETPATAWLKARGVAYTEHPYATRMDEKRLT